LPNRRCGEAGTQAIAFDGSSTVNTSDNLMWRQSGSQVVVVNGTDHSVRRMHTASSAQAQSAKALTCNGAGE